MVSYSLCNTPALADTAVSVLQSASTLAVGCEGMELGRLTGRLSLLSILAVAPVSDGASRTAYLFDFVNLPNSALAPVFALLVSPVYTKIMFDGRLDYSALCHGHGVALQNVLDLQLADAQARTESERERNRSIERYLLVDEDRKTYGPFHPKIRMLAGLGKCTRLWEVTNARDGGKTVYVDHRRWLDRPLSRRHLEYASVDVFLIGALYYFFLHGSLLPASLREQSQRYITRFRSYQPGVGLRHESFDTNGFLPLDILDYVEGSESRTCEGCRRQMALQCFKEGKSYCLVCKLMRGKLEEDYINSDEDSDPDDGGYDDFTPTFADSVGYENSENLWD